MKFAKALILFLLLNFGALGIGVWLMGDGALSEWYLNLQKAPWTPAGLVFGAAWTFIMCCFSVYMSFLILKRSTKKVMVLFVVQWILNICWNLVFFNQHLIDVGLGVIGLLTLIVAALFVTYLNDLKMKSILILPYLIWLCIATSLNLYIFIYN
ncbi:TspO/MBR family protein [Sediminibacter sp. Hel_I_10]|uniref:TspO/MBR family protein n=1 Tax=Sediminibacter sp. Hel_I_10 TaxID=1392490 RepID=UPI00047D5C88|nr:TspO/MBR family protein [Sediminibacter sp. Hel_I_10]